MVVTPKLLNPGLEADLFPRMEVTKMCETRSKAFDNLSKDLKGPQEKTYTKEDVQAIKGENHAKAAEKAEKEVNMQLRLIQSTPEGAKVKLKIENLELVGKISRTKDKAGLEYDLL